MDDCQDADSFCPSNPQTFVTFGIQSTDSLSEYPEVMTEPYPDQTPHDGEDTADAPDNEDPNESSQQIYGEDDPIVYDNIEEESQQTAEDDDSNVYDNIEETVQQTCVDDSEIYDDNADVIVGCEKTRGSVYIPLPPFPSIPTEQDASQLSPTSNDDNNDIDEELPRTESNSEQAGTEPEVVEQIDSSTAQEPEVLKESNQCDTQHETPKSTTETVTQNSLSGYKWYFGDVDRQNCERMLKKMILETGSYMVRDCKNGGPQNPYSLSVVYNKFIYHMLIRIRPDQKYAVGREKTGETVFNSIPDLITFHQNNFLELIGDAKMKTASGSVQLIKCPPPEKMMTEINFN